jgi:hypothetical protein
MRKGAKTLKISRTSVLGGDSNFQVVRLMEELAKKLLSM